MEQALDLRTLLLPQTTLTLLPGLGHIPQIEDPAIFAHELIPDDVGYSGRADD